MFIKDKLFIHNLFLLNNSPNNLNYNKVTIVILKNRLIKFDSFKVSTLLMKTF